MIKAALYLRISRDLSGERLGVERQREDAESLARLRGFEVVKVFEDNDISAAGSKVRPGFEQMLTGLSNGTFSVVVSWNLDRLTRNRPDTVRLIETAQRAKATLALCRGSDMDMSTPAGRMTADILASVARNEIEVKSERQSSGQRQRARLGRVPKGVRPLGYATSGDIVSHEADAVKKIYAAFNSGSSLRAIVAALSGKEGDSLPDIPTLPRHNRTLMLERNSRRSEDGQEQRPVPDDGPWAPSTVLGILRNPRYAGYSTYTPKEILANGDRRRSWRAQIVRNEQGEPVRGLWDRIVDVSVWENVQDKLDDPARITNRVGTDRKHLGSGLYLCGVCDKPVRAHGQRYRCEGHVLRTGSHIDDFVTEVVRRRLALPDLHDLLPGYDEPRQREIKDQIGEHRARIARAERDYDSDDDEVRISSRVLNRIVDDREAKIRALEAERAKLLSGSTANSVFGDQDPVSAFDSGDLAARRSTINLLCEVRLHPQPRGKKGFNPDSVTISWQ